MASPPLPLSSGSSHGDPRYAMFDEKKRKRMISNRESARRSRMRKQQYLDETVDQVSQLQKENNQIALKINSTTHKCHGFETENNVLRAQLAELTDRLRSLNVVLQIAAEVSGSLVEIPEIPDALLEPWQLPCPTQPITASADTFYC